MKMKSSHVLNYHVLMNMNTVAHLSDFVSSAKLCKWKVYRLNQKKINCNFENIVLGITNSCDHKLYIYIHQSSPEFEVKAKSHLPEKSRHCAVPREAAQPEHQ